MEKKEKKLIKGIVNAYLRQQKLMEEIIGRIKKNNQEMEKISAKLDIKSRKKLIKIAQRTDELISMFDQLSASQLKLILNIPGSLRKKVDKEILRCLPAEKRSEIEKVIRELQKEYKKEMEKMKQYIC